MGILAILEPLASAAVVFFGPHGAVARLARQRGTSRQTLYRQADAAAQAVDGARTRQQLDELQTQLCQAQERLRQLEQQPPATVAVDPDRLAQFAATAQAEGVSLPVARRLLAVFLGSDTPSVATLGRLTQAAGQQAGALLAVLDAFARPHARQVAADEIFTGHRPVLMIVEPESLCWLAARRVERRDAASWAEEFGRLPALEQVCCDGGAGLQKGLCDARRARIQAGQLACASQDDHFHIFREGAKALRRTEAQAKAAFAAADQAQRAAERRIRRGEWPSRFAVSLTQRWRRAERLMDRWSTEEATWRQVRQAVGLFTAQGELNSRTRAEAAMTQALAPLTGAPWKRVRRLLRRTQVLTFLDGVQERLEALPGPVELKRAAVRVEGLRRRPELLRGEGVSAAALRGVMLAATLALAGPAGQQVVDGVRRLLRSAWRASSLVEGLNSVVRMQQARHRRLPQGLLDLKRLYWNCRRLRTGRRKGQTPYARLGVRLPELPWWQLLQLSPQELRQQLSALNLPP